jgi:hypothetical protein
VYNFVQLNTGKKPWKLWLLEMAPLGSKICIDDTILKQIDNFTYIASNVSCEGQNFLS